MLDQAGAIAGRHEGRMKAASVLADAVALDTGNTRKAARLLFQQAAALAPSWDEPLIRLAQSFRAEGHVAEAKKLYLQASTLNRERVEPLLACGVLALQGADPHDAVGYLTRATELDPANHQAWHSLALAFGALGLRSAALRAIARAGNLAPDRLHYALTYNELRTAVDSQLDFQIHEPTWSTAIELCLDANAALRCGATEEAIVLLETAIDIEPGAPDILALLGNAHLANQMPEIAESHLREAVRLAPDNIDIANDLAVALGRQYKFGEAANILNNFDISEIYSPTILLNRATIRASAGDLSGCARDIEAASARANDRSRLRAECSLMPYQSNATANLLLNATSKLAATLAEDCEPLMKPSVVDPDRPLRVGLLSHTLRQHPVGWLTFAGLENLDHTEFELYCFGHFAAGDPFAKRLARRVSKWEDQITKCDAEIAANIANCDIDILIDFSGFGDNGMLGALSYRPAPVQVKWVGSQASTTGMKRVDWFITDRWETPDGFDQYYTERLLRLPDGYVCYSPPPLSPLVGNLPALTNGHVTFGCFNNLTKLTDDTLSLWGKILEQIGDAHLLLRCPQFSEDGIPDRFLSRAQACGLDTSRVKLRGRAPHPEFIAGYKDIDIALDPFPYSGGLTTCEAMFMGVPVITLAGDFFAARHSVSHLSNVGLTDCVTQTPEQYVDRAIAMSSDLGALAGRRAGLRERVLTSPLCDAKRFGRNLGAALRYAWQDYCRNGYRA
jgi:predicted O-linked N-acetylglucosamine transferase (SPINDLY family)